MADETTIADEIAFKFNEYTTRNFMGQCVYPTKPTGLLKGIADPQPKRIDKTRYYYHFHRRILLQESGPFYQLSFSCLLCPSCYP